MVGWGTIVGSAAPQCSSPSTARAALCPQTKVPQSTERTPQAMKAALWGHEQGAGGTEPTPSNMPPPGPRPPGCGALCGRSAFSAMLLCIAPGGWPKTPAAPPAHTRAHCNDTRNLVKSLAAATTRPTPVLLVPSSPAEGAQTHISPPCSGMAAPTPPQSSPYRRMPPPLPHPQSRDLWVGTSLSPSRRAHSPPSQLDTEPPGRGTHPQTSVLLCRGVVGTVRLPELPQAGWDCPHRSGSCCPLLVTALPGSRPGRFP